MSKIKRRSRVQCKLACEVVASPKRRVPGRIVTLSQGGLAVLTGASFEQGDLIRLVVDPKGARPITVSAIVWNDITGRPKDDSSTLLFHIRESQKIIQTRLRLPLLPLLPREASRLKGRKRAFRVHGSCNHCPRSSPKSAFPIFGYA